MQIKYEEWINNNFYKDKFPNVKNALIEYWKTMHDLTKKAIPERFRYNQGVFSPLLNCEAGYENPQYYNGIEGWIVKFSSGDFPENLEYRKIMESAIITLLKKIPNIHRINSSVDITPFLNLTPDLKLLSLSSCKSTKNLSPKIGLRSLKALHTLHFRACSDLEYIPAEIGNLPNLRRIELEACIKIKTLPESLAKIPSLKGIILGPNLEHEYPDLTIPPILEPYIHYRSEKDYMMI